MNAFLTRSEAFTKYFSVVISWGLKPDLHGLEQDSNVPSAAEVKLLRFLQIAESLAVLVDKWLLSDSDLKRFLTIIGQVGHDDENNQKKEKSSRINF